MCRAPHLSFEPCVAQRCQIPGCEEDLAHATAYCRRRHVCKTHQEASEVEVGEELMRYCLQCGRLQPLDCFDANKRSCRATLLKRRSKPRRTGRRSSNSAQLAMPACFTTHSAPGGSSSLLLPTSTAGPAGSSLADSLLPAQLAAPSCCWSPWDGCYSSSSDDVFTAPPHPSLMPPFYPPSLPMMAAAACQGGRAGIDWGTGAAPQQLQQQPLERDGSGDAFEAMLFELLAEELANALVQGGTRSNSMSAAGRQQQPLARCSSLESRTNGVAQMDVR